MIPKVKIFSRFLMKVETGRAARRGPVSSRGPRKVSKYMAEIAKAILRWQGFGD